jgi:transposase
MNHSFATQKGMANNLVSMQHVRILVQQLQKGFSQRRIARELQLSRNTVKQYSKRLLQSAHSLEQLQQMDDAALAAVIYAHAKQSQPDPRKEDFELRLSYFRAELKRTGVTRQLLWEEYKQAYAGGYEYSQFCELLAMYHKAADASMHFSYQPAQIMMIDFAGDTLHYVDKDSGAVVSCPVFVCVLPFSGYSFAIALPDATQPNVIKALNQCLAYFGGVPQSLKCDNMKQAVSKSCRYEPVFTDTLQQWALHNNITLLAARPGKPKDKAPVENEVKLTYQRIYAPLRDTVFFSIEQLNIAIKEQLTLHHQRAFQKKTFSRKDCFTTEEQSLLQPLPCSSYCIRHSVQAKVQKNYHITLGEDWHHYSVPFAYIGKSVNAVYDTDIVEVYYEHNRIALHRRSYNKHGYTTCKEHMPESHQRYSEQRGWNEEYFLMQAEKIGGCTYQYIKNVLQGKHFTQQAYNGCLGILRLAKSYGNDRLEAACKRALKGNSFNYRILSNILSNNLDTLELQEQQQPFIMPEHSNLRGSQAYN